MTGATSTCWIKEELPLVLNKGALLLTPPVDDDDRSGGATGQLLLLRPWEILCITAIRGRLGVLSLASWTARRFGEGVSVVKR
jgi:hypothetical protein